MHAAVVSSFGTAPAFTEVAEPEATSPNETVVDVLAVGLHPRVRSQAAGTHYTSTQELPLVPGIDGVGRTKDGGLRYFVLPDTVMGSLSERTVIDLRRSISLPDDTDVVRVAAAMNPAMSSWLALRQRTRFTPGQSVLVLGATGSAGQLAIQVARLLGAGRIVAAGRDTTTLALLPGLGADATVGLGGDPVHVDAALGRACTEVDVVLDYLWGDPAAAAMRAVVEARRDRRAPLTWIQIGSIAGPTASIPSAALRAARLEIVGSGQGSITTEEILAELPALAAAVTQGTVRIEATALPLSEVAHAWAATSHARTRIVLTPQEHAATPGGATTA